MLANDYPSAKTIWRAESVVLAVMRDVLEELAEVLFLGWERSRAPAPAPKSGKGSRRRRVQSTGARPPLSPEMRLAMWARLGLDGRKPVGLKAAAQLAGVTKQRVQQVQRQIEAAACTWVDAPALDAALATGGRDMTAQEFSTELAARGITARPWHPDAVNSLARLCGRTASVTFSQWPTTKDLTRLRVIANTVLRRELLAPIAVLAEEASGKLGRTVSEQDMTAALEDSPRHVAGDGWAGIGGTWRANRVSDVAMKVLAVAHSGTRPVTVADIHAALASRHRQKRVENVPPAPAIAAYLNAHKDFRVYADGSAIDSVVELGGPPPPLDEVYGYAAQYIIAAIMQAPGRVMTRSAIMDAGAAAGLGRDALGQMFVYGEPFVACRYNVWTLTGVDPDPADIARAREQSRQRISGDRADHGISRQGNPWWTFTITAQWRNHKQIERRSFPQYNGVYPARDYTGKPCGTIRLTAEALRGLHTYVDSRHIQDGTMLRIQLNLKTGTAKVTTVTT